MFLLLVRCVFFFVLFALQFVAVHCLSSSMSYQVFIIITHAYANAKGRPKKALTTNTCSYIYIQLKVCVRLLVYATD